jgi:hypothetical protein
MNRRALLGFGAAVPVAVFVPPSTDVPVRKTGKVEIAFKAPGPRPNGLQATRDGLWIIDQGRAAGRIWCAARTAA